MKYERLVTFAIPTTGKVDPKFMINMLIVMDQLPTGTSWRARISDQDPKTGRVMHHAIARERLVEEILEEDNSKYIMFVDSDVFLPPNGFAYLLQSRKDIVTEYTGLNPSLLSRLYTRSCTWGLTWIFQRTLSSSSMPLAWGAA